MRWCSRFNTLIGVFMGVYAGSVAAERPAPMRSLESSAGAPTWQVEHRFVSMEFPRLQNFGDEATFLRERLQQLKQESVRIHQQMKQVEMQLKQVSRAEPSAANRLTILPPRVFAGDMRDTFEVFNGQLLLITPPSHFSDQHLFRRLSPGEREQLRRNLREVYRD